MCPFCLTTAAVITKSTTDTNDVTALVTSVFLKRNKRKLLPQNEAEEVHHDDDSNRDRDTKNDVAR